MIERDATPPTFVRGNDIIDRLAADPLITDDIAAADAQVEGRVASSMKNRTWIRFSGTVSRVKKPQVAGQDRVRLGGEEPGLRRLWR